MGIKQTPGFTIIEVMLFLAVSGALAIGILATSSIAINQQRYRDALNTLQSTIQQQYNQTANVINDRNDTSSRCDGDGIVTDVNGSNTAQRRGSSDCLVLGRTIEFGEAGKAINLRTVVGYPPATNSDDTPDNELELLKQYKLFVSDTNATSTEVSWGAHAQLKDDNTTQFYIVLLRSPLTGSLRTFIQNGAIGGDGTIDTGIIKQANMQETDVCVESGGFTVASTLGIVIRADAASSNAIELLGDDQACS